ncbi:MAG: helix-turn-helix domain-containing protein [Candidatus Bathyarchaeia archaeon]
MNASPRIREVLARRIAGEIILSSKPGATMRKWRELFAISQTALSSKMALSPSVISDYESGRRKNPGTRFLRRFVWALLKIDEERGSRFIREFAKLTSSPSMAVIDIKEYPLPIPIQYFCKVINGKVVACADVSVKSIRGYTVVDSASAIETLSGYEYLLLFGATTDRALIFTNISNEISPIILVRISSLKPAVAVFHGTIPDDYSVHLAELDHIPLIYTSIPTIEQLIKTLRKLYRIALRKKLGKSVSLPHKVIT